MTIVKVENGFTVRHKRNTYVFVKWSDVIKFVSENEDIEKDEDHGW